MADCNANSALTDLDRAVITCRLCTRLIAHCQSIAAVKRRAYRDQEYWGGPVPSFGPLSARLLIVGLAPGAHGANRTGRVFTGDGSGDLLYRVLHATGFASQPVSVSRADGLELWDARITCAVHCAPPDNKPLPAEIRNCRRWLTAELGAMTNVKVVVALGRIAFDAFLATFGKTVPRGGFVFAHNAVHSLGPEQPVLISSYHPSRQNTATGKLTEPMFEAVFERARELLGVAG